MEKELTTAENILSKDKTNVLRLYKRMLAIRKFELAVQENYRKGEIPGFIHLCVGQEAVSVGVCDNLQPTDWITSTHRGHGHGLAKGVSAKEMLAELYGKSTGTNGGRGGSMHIYSSKDGLFGTNGLVGGGIPLAVGLGISATVKRNKGVAVAFFGDGAICHGSFHESLCLAAIRKSPVIFLCENNLYATCTPIGYSNLNTDIAGKAASYGIPGVRVDGNDVLAVQEAAAIAIERARNGEGPTLIEALTYRTVGHHEGDVLVGTYRTKEELENWMGRCPIKKLLNDILSSGLCTEAEIEMIEHKVSREIEEAVEFARNSPAPDSTSVGDHCWMNPVNPAVALQAPAGELKTSMQGWLTAVRDGIAEEMRRNAKILYMGEGIGERGGTFGHTKELWREFGGERIIDTPICELGFTGAAAAASAAGCRTIADLMFADFIFDATTQIINQASKLRYMSNGQVSVPMIIRAGAGQIKQAGPQHSGTFHSLWAHIPGLIVVVPSTPADAKGLMKTALNAGDPVLFLEPKSLLSTKGPVPESEEYIPFGKARLVREGTDITMISFGQPVLSCAAVATQLEKEGISCELLDLRTIMPFDIDAIVSSVKKTGRLLIVDEGYGPCSIGSEISALITENCLQHLKVPVARYQKPSVPQPFSPVLEAEVSISPARIAAKVRALVKGELVKTTYLPVTGITDMEMSVVKNKHEDVDHAINKKNEADATAKPTNTVFEVIIPNQGLTITEVAIAKWHKNSGDNVKKGEPLLDFESEKSLIEMESPVDGKLIRIVSETGDTVPIGAIIAYIEENM